MLDGRPAELFQRPEPVRESVRAYYLARTPPPATLARLVSLADVDEPCLGRGRVVATVAAKRLLPRSAAAAGMALITLLAAGFFASVRTAGDGETLAHRIGREIALNHAKELAADFAAKDWDDLRAGMKKLDFLLVEPADPTVASLRVVSSRYGSIQGNLAAQIRLEDGRGRPHTLYETMLTRDLEAVPDCAFEAGGAWVRLWREAGLLLGLAGPR